jgi:hypothetical protein
MFSNIKKINHTFSSKSLNFSKILGEHLFNLANQDKKNFPKLFRRIILLTKAFLRAVYNSIFTTPIIIFPKTQNPSIFYIRAHSGLSVDKHSQYYENVDGTTVCIFKKRRVEIDIFTFFYCFIFLFTSRKSWLEDFNFYGVKFFTINGLKSFVHLFDSFSDALKISPLLLTHSKLVSFQDHVAVENILCQIANMNNIKTFALQHALDSYKEDGPFELRRNISTYSNSVCKNIFVWGNYSKNIFKKHTDAKIFITGRPGLLNEESFSDGVVIIFENKNYYGDTNFKLLKISSHLIDLGIPVSRWFKPGHVLIKNCDVRDGPLRKIVIGSNSSLCYELGFLGFQVLLIEDAIIKESLPDSLILNNIDIIAKKYKSLENYPHDFWKYFIECSGNETVTRYKNVIMND